MAGKILLLEDDDSLSRGISFKLEKEGYQVFITGSIGKGLELFELYQPDFIICDIGLEDGSGMDFCRKIRAGGNGVRILFLTALDTEMDIVMGYEAGADDYMTKPFSLSVLLSKVNAVFTRIRHEEKVSDEANLAEVIKSGSLIFFKAEMKLTDAGNIVSLTRNELRLMALFLEYPGQVLTKARLLESLWDSNGEFVDENAIAVNIRRLREKIEVDPSRPVYIKNVRGIGYLWDKETFR